MHGWMDEEASCAIVASSKVMMDGEFVLFRIPSRRPAVRQADGRSERTTTTHLFSHDPNAWKHAPPGWIVTDPEFIHKNRTLTLIHLHKTQPLLLLLLLLLVLLLLPTDCTAPSSPPYGLFLLVLVHSLVTPI
jgi:hypothetical protein